MAPGETRRSFLLGPEGKLRFLLWVVMEEDRVGLVTEDGRGAELAQALGRYRIRVDVEIEEETGDVRVVVGDWTGPDVSWGDVERHLVLGQKPDLPEGSPAEYELARIRAGEPAWGVDVDDATIPHESGLVPLSVDFDKGCFLGQELVARIDSRGAETPRHLAIIATEAGDLAPGVEISRAGEPAGVVTSAGGGVGLAMVRRGIEDGATVEVGGLPARVLGIPSKSEE